MSFDLLAPHYRWIEAVFAQDRLQRCRTAALARISTPKNVLVYGEGNGRFLAEFIRRFPEAQVTVVEASGEMIRLSRERLQRERLAEASVAFVQADALAWEPPAAAFDLIVTCFFLDCFREDQLISLIPTIANRATRDAQWLVSDFQIASSGLRRWRCRVIVGALYAFFRLMTNLPGRRLTDPARLLQAAGFSRSHHEEFDRGLLYCDLWRRGETASQARRIT